MVKIIHSKTVFFSLLGMVFICNANSAEETTNELLSSADIGESAETIVEDYLAAQRSKELLEEKIQELEVSANFYAQELSEPYLDLGHALQSLGRHEEAVTAFNYAFQVARISYGLNSEQQLPVLAELLVSNEEQKDWEEVDSNHHLINYIATKNYNVNDERRQDAITQLGRWKLRAIDEDLFPSRGELIALETELFYLKEINHLKKQPAYSGQDIHLVALLLGNAAIQAYVVRDIMARPVDSFRSLEPRELAETQCMMSSDQEGNPLRICRQVTVANPDYYRGLMLAKRQEVSSKLSMMKVSLNSASEILEQDAVQGEGGEAFYDELTRLGTLFNQLSKELARMVR